ncbi:Cro/CI family transcriptional regulator [Pseudomonas sp. GD03842]|uniref:Cro/CI family transcriptional regulator n=1 Tax=Pseudomonas sp. GD03842 TaxID=2975385 RepID=UPI00244B7F43|nr:Cro/CI family transcriptional regulator [Pseudomonas sp. GD03842]MDH0745760.1 Cro/CI family transcriptional regulator [Pseudomonas sp. GD03842]
MNKPIPSMQDLAADAEFQLLCAADQLNWLTALANAIQLDHTHGCGKYAAHLAQLAAFLSDTGFSGVHSAICEFKGLSESAPQSAEIANRGANDSRVSLAEFARGRHAIVASELGMTQGSLSKAIREGRSIFVTGNSADGYVAIEEKPFPTQRRSVEVSQ